MNNLEDLAIPAVVGFAAGLLAAALVDGHGEPGTTVVVTEGSDRRGGCGCNQGPRVPVIPPASVLTVPAAFADPAAAAEPSTLGMITRGLRQSGNIRDLRGWAPGGVNCMLYPYACGMLGGTGQHQ